MQNGLVCLSPSGSQRRCRQAPDLRFPRPALQLRILRAHQTRLLSHASQAIGRPARHSCCQPPLRRSSATQLTSASPPVEPISIACSTSSILRLPSARPSIGSSPASRPPPLYRTELFIVVADFTPGSPRTKLGVHCEELFFDCCGN